MVNYKEVGKRIFDDEHSNVILGFTKKVNTHYYERTNMTEVDSAKSIEELLVALDSLFKDHRVFQLVCINLTTLPEINNRCGRAVGNMIMNEYIKKLKNNFRFSNYFDFSFLLFFIRDFIKVNS